MSNYCHVEALLNKFNPFLTEKATLAELLGAGYYQPGKVIRPVTRDYELKYYGSYLSNEAEPQLEGRVRQFIHTSEYGPSCAMLHPELGWVVIVQQGKLYEATLAHELGHIKNALEQGFFAHRDEYLAWVTAEVILGRKLTPEEEEFKAESLATYGYINGVLTWNTMANHEYMGDKQLNSFFTYFAESIRLGLVA